MIPQNINYATLIPTLLAAFKIVLQPFGIEIPDEHINLAVNVIAGLATLVGVYLPHTKAAAIATTISKGSSNIQWNVMTYKEGTPLLKSVRDDINNLLTDATTPEKLQDVLQAFTDIKQVIDAAKKPEPLPEVTESQVSA